jgi:putative membrane protein
MRILRFIFWFALTLAVAAFSARNWSPVTLALWGDLVMDTVLPVPILLAFLLGLLPYLILHRATRWALRRKLHQTERQLTEMRALAPSAEADIASSGTIPPSAAPIAVPPGVS